MGYDVFIFCLTILGISTVVVFSYKIFRSRVYPIGMVRKIPESQEVFDELSARTKLVMSLLDRGWSDEEIALHFYDIEDYHQRTGGVYAKRLSVQAKKQQYKIQLVPYWEQERSNEPDTLETEVSEHSEALKLHDKLFKDIEQRMRKLEVESVQKLQESTDEKPQPPQVVH